MRIALVTDYYLPTLGGVQTVVKAHSETLKQSGHEVTVYAPLVRPSSDSSIVRLPTATRFAPDGYPFAWSPRKNLEILRRSFVERAIEVVHVHTEMYGSLAAIRAAKELNLPLVQTMHGRVDVYAQSVLPFPSVSSILLATLHRISLGGHERIKPRSAPYTLTRTAQRMWRLMVSQANQVDQVIVPSAHFATKLVAQGVRTPVTVLSNGVEDSLLTAIGDPLTRVLVPDEPLRVMWCGRVSPEKRPTVFVDALQQVEGVTADLFGDGVARISLAKRAGELPDGRLSVHGPVSQSRVLHAMRSSHVLASTSYDFDNQPMVILEAMASGLPIVLCDPDLAEGLPDGSYAITQTPDAHGLAAVLRRFVAHPENIQRMSEASIRGRHCAAQKTHRDALIHVYTSAVSRSAPEPGD